MKSILSTFLDYQASSLDAQLELFKKLNLNHFIMRRIGGKHFYELDDTSLDVYVSKLKDIKVIAIDPLLEAFPMDHIKALTAYNNTLELIVSQVKKFKPTYYIYTIPKFDDQTENLLEIIQTVKDQIKIIKKAKLKVLIKFSDNHTPKIYRYILGALKDRNVEIMFDYVYLYKRNEAEITAYRILRNYIGMVIMDDVDKLGCGRVIGSSENIPVAQIAKRFIKRKFEGYIVLDSSLVDLLCQANNQGWFSKMVSKKVKHELKIYNDFIERYRSTDIFRILRIQMAVLSLMFLNKKVALG